MKQYAILSVIILMLILSAAPSRPLAAQATDTNTPTATWNNTQRVQYATIPFASGCDPFNPCGALPWPVPRFPTVNLPTSTLYTIMPTVTAIPATVTPSATFTPSETPTNFTPTITPTGTYSGGIDLGPVSTFADEFGGLAKTLSVQSTAVIDIGGTPVGMNEIGAGLAANIAAPFAVINAVQQQVGGLGLLGTLINFAFYSLLYVLFVYGITLLLPFLMRVVQIILQILQIIASAIP
jgi:hypothetical protein